MFVQPVSLEGLLGPRSHAGAAALHQVQLSVRLAGAEAFDAAVGPADLDLIDPRRGAESEGETEVALGEVAGAAAHHAALRFSARDHPHDGADGAAVAPSFPVPLQLQPE